MNKPFSIFLDAEDNLLCVIGERLLGEFSEKYKIRGIAKKHRHAGSGIRQDARQWNNAAAKGDIRLALMDLDALAPPQSRKKCPESEIRKALSNQEKHEKFLLRVAVFESESWLLADREGFARFFSIPNKESIPDNVDDLEYTKEHAYNIIRACKGDVRKHKLAKKMLEFAKSRWKPKRAAKNSKSLRRTLERLDKFSG